MILEIRSAEGGEDARLLHEPARGKVCSRCKDKKPASAFSPRPERPVGLAASCKTCKSRHRSERYYRRRAEEPVALWLQNVLNWAKDRARRHGLAFALRREDLAEMLRVQDSRCIYCAAAFNFQRTTRTRKDSPTIDQITPRAGYAVRNVTLCCYRCNALKGDATPDELRRIADGIDKLTDHRLGICMPAAKYLAGELPA